MAEKEDGGFAGPEISLEPDEGRSPYTLLYDLISDELLRSFVRFVDESVDPELAQAARSTQEKGLQVPT